MQVPESRSESPGESEPLNLSETGRRDGEAISLDRRLFMKFTAFGGCAEPQEAIEQLAASGLRGVLYVDANDAKGIGIMVASESPECFVSTLRALFNRAPFVRFEHKGEFDMLGRSYALGYEADLETTLLRRPQQRLLDPALTWAVWYPVRRAKSFPTLPAAHQRRILGEHGALARRYSTGGHAVDIRLACHGLDKHDNDFIVGLLGPQLHPLSLVVQEMRKTEQTSRYLDSLGPFFVGKVAWQARL